MKKDKRKWVEQEFKDSKRILSLKKDELYIEIWKARSNLVPAFLIGFLVGIGFYGFLQMLGL